MKKIIIRIGYLIAENISRKDMLMFVAGMVSLWTFLAIKWKFDTTYYIASTTIFILVPGQWASILLRLIALVSQKEDQRVFLRKKSIDISFFGHLLDTPKR